MHYLGLTHFFGNGFRPEYSNAAIKKADIAASLFP
jgi:hypothetical protein